MSDGAPDTRADRERAAYDKARVAEISERWLVRAIHVQLAPNTLRGERRFEEIVAAAARGGRVLDLGCGAGEMSARLLEMGAEHVLGIDISESEIARARQRAVPGRLDFRVGDVAAVVDERFDLIYGRSVLHHIDYPPILRRMYAENLAPGGTLAFMEPLGTNLITRLFHRFVPSAHTPDERPLRRDELRWLEASFPSFQMLPVNYASYPAAIASSLVFSSPDNALLRAADRIDQRIERSVPRLAAHFRQGILVIHKPVA